MYDTRVRATMLPLLLTVLAARCANEFSTEPAATVQIEQAAGWRSDLAVTDTAQLEIRLLSAARELKAPHATWESSDDGVLRVESIATGDRGDDSPEARRTRVRVIALSSGTVSVTVRISASGGIPQVERTFEFAVHPLSVERTSGRVQLSVSESDTFKVRVSKPNGAATTAFRLAWESSNESLLRVEALASNTGQGADSLAAKHYWVRLIALAPGDVDVRVTAEGILGVEAPQTTLRLQILPVHLEPIGWRDTLSVADTISLGVRLVNSLGAVVSPASVAWLSSSDSNLTLAAATATARLAADRHTAALVTAPLITGGSVAITAVARARGSLTITASAVGAGGNTVASLTRNVRIMERWVQVVGFTSSTCGLTVRGFVYCWGAPVGNESQSYNSSPKLAAAPYAENSIRFRSLTAGQNHVCGESAIADGLWYCWGVNDAGQLTNGTTFHETFPVPMRLRGMTLSGLSVATEVSCGLSSSRLELFFVRSVYCWGQRTEAIGPGWDTRFEQDFPGVNDAINAELTGCDLVPCAGYYAVSVGARHGCALYEADGFLFGITEWVACWGRNSSGQLGQPLTVTSNESATAIFGDFAEAGQRSLTHLVSLPNASCVLDLGTAICWGDGFGVVPTAVMSGVRWSMLTASRDGDQVCGLGLLDQRARCFSTKTTQLIATPITGADGRDLRYASVMAAGRVITALGRTEDARHYCGITTGDGATYCWGNNVFGQVGGDSQGAPVLVPLRVREPVP